MITGVVFFLVEHRHVIFFVKRHTPVKRTTTHTTHPLPTNSAPATLLSLSQAHLSISFCKHRRTSFKVAQSLRRKQLDNFTHDAGISPNRIRAQALARWPLLCCVVLWRVAMRCVALCCVVLCVWLCVCVCVCVVLCCVVCVWLCVCVCVFVCFCMWWVWCVPCSHGHRAGGWVL